jgi:outer membrane protein OmpA-like peptidoglycan-associated protein
MKNKIWMALALVMLLPVMFLTVSCAKRVVEAEPVTTPAPVVTTTEAEREAEQQRRAAEQARIEEERLRSEAAARQAARTAFVDEHVLFDFDSSALTPRAQQNLTAKAAYLRDNPNAVQSPSRDTAMNVAQLHTTWRWVNAVLKRPSHSWSIWGFRPIA